MPEGPKLFIFSIPISPRPYRRATRHPSLKVEARRTTRVSLFTFFASGSIPPRRQRLELTIQFRNKELTRSQVVTGLATLQDAIQTLSTAYIKHTNAVLGEHGAELNVGNALSKLGENPLLGPLANLQRAVSPAITGSAAPVEGAAPDKKERKKRQHDPNAPKRPLTPFFLYMQTARPIIAKDLGSEVAKGAVSAEGTRRWKEMAEGDRLVLISTPNRSTSTNMT